MSIAASGTCTMYRASRRSSVEAAIDRDIATLRKLIYRSDRDLEVRRTRE